MMTHGYVKQIQAGNSSEFADKLTKTFNAGLNFDPATRTKVASVIQAWSASLPAEFWTDPEGRSKWVQSSRVRDAAVRQRELMQRIFRSVDLSPDTRAKLAGNLKLFLPRPRSK